VIRFRAYRGCDLNVIGTFKNDRFEEFPNVKIYGYTYGKGIQMLKCDQYEECYFYDLTIHQENELFN
jgi:hypothetical protein